jgi:GTP pyrophosphokinase
VRQASPIAVASLVASEIGLGYLLQLCSFMMWLKIPQQLSQDIERLFNPKVAQLVEGLTKISMVQRI